ncbi:unnamed protein product [Heligmosomoides polygyrus]|uniref:Receptor expression-enhancing protein n=1 Tax=Heligmosomoides polygyrus TaxID=6339 RepID=A0A183GWH0_HELPZ|nr:unnamed protein product [Heligmosomoides polygyrus]
MPVSRFPSTTAVPRLRTFSALQAVRSKQTDDDTQWLVYWCVFAIFSFMDFFASSIMQWFPLYWLIKAIFLIILFLPQTMGAQFLFTTYVDPLVTTIDDFYNKSKEEE